MWIVRLHQVHKFHFLLRELLACRCWVLRCTRKLRFPAIRLVVVMCCCCRCVFFLLSFCTWVRDSSSLFIHKFYRSDDQFVHRGRTELTPHTQFKRISFKAAGKINKIFGGFKFGTQRKQQLLLSRERNQLVFVYLLYLFRNSVFFWWLRCVCMYICLFVFLRSHDDWSKSKESRATTVRPISISLFCDSRVSAWSSCRPASEPSAPTLHCFIW